MKKIIAMIVAGVLCVSLSSKSVRDYLVSPSKIKLELADLFMIEDGYVLMKGGSSN